VSFTVANAVMSGVRYRNVRAPVISAPPPASGSFSRSTRMRRISSPLARRSISYTFRHAQDQRLALVLAALADEQQDVAFGDRSGCGREIHAADRQGVDERRPRIGGVQAEQRRRILIRDHRGVGWKRPRRAQQMQAPFVAGFDQREL